MSELFFLIMSIDSVAWSAHLLASLARKTGSPTCRSHWSNIQNKQEQQHFQAQRPKLAYLAGRREVEWMVTQYWTRDTRNMIEASQCIYALICPLTVPATSHFPGNGLGHLRIVECPNVHIISIPLLIHYYACENKLVLLNRNSYSNLYNSITLY